MSFQGSFDSTSDPTKQALIQALQGVGQNGGFQPGQGAYGAIGSGAAALTNRAIQNQIQNQIMGNMFAQNRATQMGGYTPNDSPPGGSQQVQMPAGLFGGP